MAQVQVNDTDNKYTLADYASDDINIKMRYPSTGTLFDLTGYSASFYLRDTKDVTVDPVVEYTDADNIDLTSVGTTHNISITIPKDTLTPGTYYGYFVLVDSLGITDTLTEITLKLRAR